MSKFDIVGREWLESAEYERKKEILRKEINSRPFIIDYSVFKKTKEEKMKALQAKWKNELDRKHYYGKDYKKYLNVPKHIIKLIKT